MPSSIQFKIPSLSTNAVPPSGVNLVLPKLGNLSLDSTGSQNSYSSLADFAKVQLSNWDKSGSQKALFAIPKVIPSEPKVINFNTEPETILIDLKSALVPEIEKRKISCAPKPPKVKENVEIFTPQFIDCDNTSGFRTKDFILDELSERITLKELKTRYKNCSLKKFSTVGKIIRLKFKKSFKPIRHVDRHKHSIKRFDFDTPSPDDKILAHLNKNKK